MHKSNVAPSLDVPSCTVTSLARSHLTVQLKNLAGSKCITCYFLAADREKYCKKCAAVFAFTSPKIQIFAKLCTPFAFEFLVLLELEGIRPSDPPLQSPSTYMLH